MLLATFLALLLMAQAHCAADSACSLRHQKGRLAVLLLLLLLLLLVKLTRSLV